LQTGKDTLRKRKTEIEPLVFLLKRCNLYKIKNIKVGNMSRWMIVYKNMRWEEIDFSTSSDIINIKLLRKNESLNGRITKYNDFTKVYRVILSDGREVDIADFAEIDNFFESNKIIFKNRTGLHKEIRRYIDFSLS